MFWYKFNSLTMRQCENNTFATTFLLYFPFSFAPSKSKKETEFILFTQCINNAFDSSALLIISHCCYNKCLVKSWSLSPAKRTVYFFVESWFVERISRGAEKDLDWHLKKAGRWWYGRRGCTRREASPNVLPCRLTYHMQVGRIYQRYSILYIQK